jgi:hypothetical protein
MRSALQPRLPLLRRHPRALLLRLEQTRRPAVDHHVHRPARLGARVLISGIWYNPSAGAHAAPPARFPSGPTNAQNPAGSAGDTGQRSSADLRRQLQPCPCALEAPGWAALGKGAAQPKPRISDRSAGVLRAYNLGA